VDIQIIQPGDGFTFPVAGDVITTNYVGTLKDGRMFDSTKERGASFIVQIGVGKVIRGWDEAIIKLSLGTKALLTIPAELAYGARGFPPLIPPNADLLFELILVKIDRAVSIV
ncbi:peptidyl-prolyl cis-trans isomerase, partial [Peniophora sp. CONT]